MISARKGNRAFEPPVTPAAESVQEQQQQTVQDEQQFMHRLEKQHKKTPDAEITAETAQRTPHDTQEAVTGASQQARGASLEAPATAAATPATADLLPTELLQQLMQARKVIKPAAASSNQLQVQQGVRKHRQQQKQKQRITQIQKGPVRVAVLSAVAEAAEAGTAFAAGAAVRQQLLESRVQRSKDMLQPVPLQAAGNKCLI